MLITRRSFLTNTIRTKWIDVTPGQIVAWNSGALIQNAMPHLSADEREFIMTGATPEEWDAAFSEEGESEEDEPAF